MLGTPTPAQLAVLNPKVPENKFPVVKGKTWDKVLPSYATEEACDLMDRLMQYSPSERITAVEVFFLFHVYSFFLNACFFLTGTGSSVL